MRNIHIFRTGLGQEKLVKKNMLFLWDCLCSVTQNSEEIFQMSNFIRSVVFSHFNQMESEKQI